MTQTILPGERRDIQGDDCRLSVTVAGEGPLLILMHGWPELALSWRHLVAPLVAAGYQVVVPDMRGYGASDKPDDPLAYRLDVIARDMDAIARALNADAFVAIGHDWGALCAWGTALRLGPARVRGVLAMSVPYSPPLKRPYADLLDKLYPDQFFYIRYFQELGVVEAEFAARGARNVLKSVYYKSSAAGIASNVAARTPRDAPFMDSVTPPPNGPLPFMSDAELDQYAQAFDAGGWRGPINYYRNFDRNFASSLALGDYAIQQPAGFIAGAMDPVITMFPNQLETMRSLCRDYRLERMIEGAGHWVQQEAPEATIAATLEFLETLG